VAATIGTGRLLGWVGRGAINGVGLSLDLLWFATTALRSWLRERSGNRQLGFSPVVNQVLHIGVGTLPLVTLLGLASGFVLTYRLIVLFGVIGGETVLDVLVNVVAMELWPLIIAIVLIGRSGSAITVELATMRARGEVQSLELLGVDLDYYLVGPRLVGAALAQLSLAVYFTVITLAAGVVIAGILMSGAYLSYLPLLAESFGPVLILVFVLKNLAFGLVMASAACYYGLDAEQSTAGLHRQIYAAVIAGVALVFVTDGLFALLLW
jgi:phospholipid/cholesterol/gamma-HCH transport system permease protein